MTNTRHYTPPTSDEAEALYHRACYAHGVVIKFGQHGEQYAHVIHSGRRTHHKRVRIWRKNSGRWTKPRRLYPGEIIRIATEDDDRKFQPDFGPAWER